MKLKDFKKHCKDILYVSELVNPVLNQLGGDWEDKQNDLRGVSECGAAGGFGGFIYYSETCEFYKRNRARIVRSLEDLADGLGEGVIEMVRNFNCIKGDYSVNEIGKALYGRYNEDYQYIYNALAWYALEEVANEFVDYEYELEHE